MSKLPQRRKSAEELAELRESLGIPDELPPAAPPPPGASATPAPPKPGRAESKRSKSKRLKSKGNAPALGPRSGPFPTETASKPENKQAQAGPSPHGAADEPVILLRVPESEGQARLVTGSSKRALDADSTHLPTHRRDPDALRALQRAAAFAPLADPADRLRSMMLPAWAVVGIYLLSLVPLSALTGMWLHEHPVKGLPTPLTHWLANDAAGQQLGGTAVLGGVVLLLLAGWIAWRRKRSRHHATMLIIIAVLAVTFGVLYLFPELHGAQGSA